MTSWVNHSPPGPTVQQGKKIVSTSSITGQGRSGHATYQNKAKRANFRGDLNKSPSWDEATNPTSKMAYQRLWGPGITLSPKNRISEGIFCFESGSIQANRQSPKKWISEEIFDSGSYRSALTKAKPFIAISFVTSSLPSSSVLSSSSSPSSSPSKHHTSDLPNTNGGRVARPTGGIRSQQGYILSPDTH